MPITRQPSEVDEGGDIVAHRLVHGGVAHDAFLDGVAAGLELRLDQRDELRRWRCTSASAAGSTCFNEMKLTSMVTRSGVRIEMAGCEGADIGRFQRHDLRPRAQALVQLPVPDIDRVDAASRRAPAAPA